MSHVSNESLLSSNNSHDCHVFRIIHMIVSNSNGDHLLQGVVLNIELCTPHTLSHEEKESNMEGVEILDVERRRTDELISEEDSICSMN